jgi:hypothetical protein
MDSNPENCCSKQARNQPLAAISLNKSTYVEYYNRYCIRLHLTLLVKSSEMCNLIYIVQVLYYTESYNVFVFTLLNR